MSILVMRYSSLGDVALTNPVLDSLDRAYPNAQVYFATKDRYAPAVESHPAVNRVLELHGGGFWNFVKHLKEILAVRPTLVLDLHNSLRTHIISLLLWRSRILSYDKETVQRRLLVKKLRKEPSLHTINKYLKVLEPLGIAMPTKVDFKIHISKFNHQFLRDFLARRRISTSRLVIGLGPGARWKTKQWMPENYAEMASGLVKDHNALLFWFGSREEKKLIQSIQNQMTVNVLDRGISLAGDYSLEQSITLLGRCDLFIGNDSGLIHLASGRGTRTVVLYGSTAPSLGFEPWGPHTVVEVANLPCRPCHVHGYNACPLGHFKCMKNLTVNLVEGAVTRSLQRSR
jgi:heptosyltransferase-2